MAIDEMFTASVLSGNTDNKVCLYRSLGCSIFCHDIVQGDRDHPDIPESWTWIDYVGDIMVIRQDEQEVGSTRAREE